MSRKTAADKMADVGIDPLTDAAHDYQLMREKMSELEDWLFRDGRRPDWMGASDKDTWKREWFELRKLLVAERDRLLDRQHPKLKAMELTGAGGGPINASIAVSFVGDD